MNLQDLITSFYANNFSVTPLLHQKGWYDYHIAKRGLVYFRLYPYFRKSDRAMSTIHIINSINNESMRMRPMMHIQLMYDLEIKSLFQGTSKWTDASNYYFEQLKLF